jgi:PAS domain S-box-containing protein
MIAVGVDESRCITCNKLLFRGALGIGFIETKCARCGTINIVHNFDGILEGRTGAYIIVYNSNGEIIIASKSVKSVLGYEVDEICNKTISDICARHDGIKTHLALTGSVTSIAAWEKQHAHMPHEIIHIAKDGKKIAANARYYPLHALANLYTMCVFYADLSVKPVIGIEELFQGPADQPVIEQPAA